MLDNVAVVFKIIFFIFSLPCLNLNCFILWYVTFQEDCRVKEKQILDTEIESERRVDKYHE